MHFVLPDDRFAIPSSSHIQLSTNTDIMATNSAEGPNIKVEMDMNPLGQDPPSIASSIPNPLKDADFQKAMDSTLSVCRNLSKVLEAFPYGTKRDDLTKLIKTKLIDSHKQLPKAEKIALVGRTGVGKSSLLCALCNDGGLARCEASGEAVRNIIQEFRQRAEGDIDGYKIICTFQTEAEVKEQMSNLLDDLRRYDSDEIETTDPEFTSAQENYHLAWISSTQCLRISKAMMSISSGMVRRAIHEKMLRNFLISGQAVCFHDLKGIKTDNVFMCALIRNSFRK